MLMEPLAYKSTLKFGQASIAHFADGNFQNILSPLANQDSSFLGLWVPGFPSSSDFWPSCQNVIMTVAWSFGSSRGLGIYGGLLS